MADYMAGNIANTSQDCSCYFYVKKLSLWLHHLLMRYQFFMLTIELSEEKYIGWCMHWKEGNCLLNKDVLKLLQNLAKTNPLLKKKNQNWRKFIQNLWLLKSMNQGKIYIFLVWFARGLLKVKRNWRYNGHLCLYEDAYCAIR